MPLKYSNVKSHLNGAYHCYVKLDLFGVWPSYLFLGATTLHVFFCEEEACKYSHPEVPRKHCVHKNSVSPTHLSWLCPHLSLPHPEPSLPLFVPQTMKLRKYKYTTVANTLSKVLSPFNKKDFQKDEVRKGECTSTVFMGALYNSLGSPKFNFTPGQVGTWLFWKKLEKNIILEKIIVSRKKILDDASRNSHTAKVMNILTLIQMFPEIVLKHKITNLKLLIFLQKEKKIKKFQWFMSG